MVGCFGVRVSRLCSLGFRVVMWCLNYAVIILTGSRACKQGGPRKNLDTPNDYGPYYEVPEKRIPIFWKPKSWYLLPDPALALAKWLGMVTTRP